MPPKPKRTRAEVLEAAVAVVREEGIGALTARRLAQQLDISAPAVFTHFSSMDELKDAVTSEVRGIYGHYVSEGLEMNPPFKGFAVKVIEFAEDNPNLFELLFMKRQENISLEKLIQNEGNEGIVIDIIQKSFDLNEKQAQELYLMLWTFVYGISTLIITGACSFSKEEISTMLGKAFRGMIISITMPEDDRVKMVPEVGADIEGSFSSYVYSNVKEE